MAGEAGELEAIVRELFADVDRQDFAAVVRALDAEAQLVEEVARRWLRGRAEVEAYFCQLAGAVADIRTQVRDVHEVVWGEVGVVTCWVEQAYTLGGRRQQLSAPTTVVLRRGGGAWRIALFHSIPLPEGASG